MLTTTQQVKAGLPESLVDTVAAMMVHALTTIHERIKYQVNQALHSGESRQSRTMPRVIILRKDGG
jgi:hypothetical protein